MLAKSSRHCFMTPPPRGATRETYRTAGREPSNAYRRAKSAAGAGTAMPGARGRPRRLTRGTRVAGEHVGNKMSTMNMVILLLAVVLSVFVGFAWMAYCFR